MNAEHPVGYGCQPGEQGKFHLGESRPVPSPVDAGLKDVHAFLVKVPGDGGVITFSPRFPDSSVRWAVEVDRPDPCPEKKNQNPEEKF